MAFLSRNKVAYFLLSFLVCGCATSSFNLIKQGDFVVELKVTPDRVYLSASHSPVMRLKTFMAL